METGDLLRELIAFLEQAAPVVWAVARRQVFVVATQEVVAALLCGLGVRLAYKQYWKVNNNPDDYFDNGDSWRVLCFGVGVTVTILGIVSLMGALGKFVNPDYYAIGLLLQYVQ